MLRLGQKPCCLVLLKTGRSCNQDREQQEGRPPGKSVHAKWFQTLFMVTLESEAPNIQQVAPGMVATVPAIQHHSIKELRGVSC